LKGQGRSQHWLALVCMPFAPADGVMRHAHLNRVPSVLAGAANPSPHHFVWQVAIGDWRPVFFATALGTIHRALWGSLPVKSGRFWSVDNSEGGNRGPAQD
jgi:hypothetical protein